MYRMVQAYNPKTSSESNVHAVFERQTMKFAHVFDVPKPNLLRFFSPPDVWVFVFFLMFGS